jgi:hypothetical protein
MAIPAHGQRARGGKAAVIACIVQYSGEEPKEQGMPTDTELWRAGSLLALDEAIPYAASVGMLSPIEMTDEWEAARAARFRHDDAVLMQFLMKYCPDDPHIENYPGPDA